jgi:hypothetical protein
MMVIKNLGRHTNHGSAILRGADSSPVVPALALATPSVGVRVDDERHILLAATAHHTGVAATATRRRRGAPRGRAHLGRPVRRGRREPLLISLRRRRGVTESSARG